jgi:pimeloyl-ACP methyl ester carboxylesterase
MTRAKAGWLVAAVVCTLVVASAKADEVIPRFESAKCWFSKPAGAVDCGYLIVPANRRKADGKTVRVAVATVRPTLGVRYPDPVVIVGGGPGYPIGLTDAGLVEWRKQIRRTPAFQQRDVILVEQRGVGRSEPSLDCDELDALGASAEYLLTNSDTSAKEEIAAAIACSDRLLRDGVDLAGYSGIEFAADLADLRRAIGYDAWNLVGTSYGSRIALTVMRDHPEGLRAVVLNSVYPLEVQFLENYWGTAERMLNLVFAACEDNDVCRKEYPDIAAHYVDTVARMNEKPVTVEVPRTGSGQAMALPVSGWMVGETTLDLMASSDWRTAIAYVDAVSAGDAHMIEATAKIISDKYADSEQFSDGVYYSAICQEEFPFDDAAAVHADYRVYERLLGVNWSDTREAICDAWPVDSAPPSENAAVSSDIPTLLLAGTWDYITPPDYADVVHQRLPNSYLIMFPKMGHDVISTNYCGLLVVDEFLNHPDRKPSSWCALYPIEPDFK